MKKSTILIVEDERILAIDLAERLSSHGYQVLPSCSTANEAVRAAKTHSPDLILMDIMLDGPVDGIDAAKIIQDQMGIPIVFLTAFSDNNTLKRVREIGPFGYIVKPVGDQDLLSSVDIAIYKSRMDAELQRRERWLSAILRSVEDGIIATDVVNRIRFMNPVAEQVTGLSSEEVKGRPVEEIVILHDERTGASIHFPGPDIEISPDEPFLTRYALLTRNDGSEVHVSGAVLSIKDGDGNIEGKVFSFRDTSEIQAISRKLSHQSRHDALTGLANRGEFTRRLNEIIDQTQGTGTMHGLIVLDIDEFKLVNDTCGHATGDSLLKRTADTMRDVVRASDICARFGADEFAVLLFGSRPDTTREVATRLHERLRSEKITQDGKTFPLNASMGIATIDASVLDYQTGLANADDACRVAKEEGGNRIRVYEPSSSRFRQRRGEMQWIGRLSKALDEGAFRLFYQTIEPITNPDEPEKLEILIRMVAEDQSIVMPADFIPAAERYNLMPEIDRWVITSVGEEYHRHVDLLGRDLGGRKICVNLSAASLAEDSFPKFIKQFFDHSQVPAELFCFEITETAAITNMNSVTSLIQDLKEMGCSLALDDFGSGFSSFNYLRTLPVDYLKIDGIFVKDMDVDTVNRAMVEAIHNLGRVMNIKTIAEFVGSPQVKKLVRDLGVDYAQGYEISKPRPITSLAGLASKADSISKH